MRLSLFPLLFAAAITLPAAAQSPAKKKAPPFVRDPVALTVFADQLAAWGEDQADPFAFLLAAKVLRSVQAVDGKSGAPVSNAATVEALEARARALAKDVVGDDPYTFSALVDAMRPKVARSRTLLRGEAQKQFRGRVGAGQSQDFAISFKGEEQASVGLVLDVEQLAGRDRSEIDLDLYIRDDQNIVVAAIEGPGVPEFYAWTPARSGKFIITVKNPGRVDAPYIVTFR